MVSGWISGSTLHTTRTSFTSFTIHVTDRIWWYNSYVLVIRCCWSTDSWPVPNLLTRLLQADLLLLIISISLFVVWIIRLRWDLLFVVTFLGVVGICWSLVVRWPLVVSRWPIVQILITFIYVVRSTLFYVRLVFVVHVTCCSIVLGVCCCSFDFRPRCSFVVVPLLLLLVIFVVPVFVVVVTLIYVSVVVVHSVLK